MSDYAVTYEQGPDGAWHASVTDLPVFSVGETLEHAQSEVKVAIALYLEVLAEHGETPQAPHTVAGTVRV